MINKQLEILDQIRESERAAEDEVADLPYRNALGYLLPWEEPKYIEEQKQLEQKRQKQQGKKNE